MRDAGRHQSISRCITFGILGVLYYDTSPGSTLHAACRRRCQTPTKKLNYTTEMLYSTHCSSFRKQSRSTEMYYYEFLSLSATLTEFNIQPKHRRY